MKPTSLASLAFFLLALLLGSTGRGELLSPLRGGKITREGRLRCDCDGVHSGSMAQGSVAGRDSSKRGSFAENPFSSPSCQPWLKSCSCLLHGGIGFSTLDREFLPPRSWHFTDLFHRSRADPVIERDTCLLDDHFYRPMWRWTGDIVQDHRHFYSWEGIQWLGLGIGAHAVLANTSLDEQFREFIQEDVAGDPKALKFASYFGDTWIVVPALAAIWIVDGLVDQHSWLERHWHPDLDDWASQSLRALLVGAPVTGTLQALIGASRPGENAAGSRWRPFHDNNGVSGHAFVGAVPFLVAAKHSENVLLRSMLIAGSTLTAYSRIHEDKHYLSQALLGWGIAYLAVEATDRTERSSLQYRVVPLSLDGLVGVGLEFRR